MKQIRWLLLFCITASVSVLAQGTGGASVPQGTTVIRAGTLSMATPTRRVAIR